MGASAPGTIFKRTVSTVTVMLAAWAAFVGTITLVMLMAISHAKSEIPANTGTEANAGERNETPISVPAREGFKPSRSSQLKPPTRI